jgi:hypothetical protein
MKKNQVKTVIKASTKQGRDVSVKEVILSDVTKSSLNEIVTSAINAYDAGIKKAEAVYLTAESLASALGTEPTYETWTAQFNYVEREIVARRKISVESAQNLLTEVRKTMATAFGLEKPKAKSRTAEANAKARAEFADAPVAKLQAEKIALAKNGDAQSLKRAVKIQAEIEKRAKLEASANAKAESKGITKLRKTLKDWIQGMDAEMLADLVWVRENPNEVKKLARKQ